MVRRTFSFALLLVAGLSVPAHALRFYVNQSTGDNRRSHVVAQDSATPWRTMTHALQMAHIITQGRPHVIDIAAGSYSPSSGETFPFVISQTQIYLSSQGRVVLDAQGRSRIIQVTAPTSDFVLRDFSLVNGAASRGGAVSCESCSLRVVDSRILSNEASEGGDAIYVAGGRLQLINNIIRFNGASGTGGAVIEARNTFADTTKRDVIRNNTFYRNNKPTILTTGNRTDISSNILVGNSGSGLPAIIDSAAGIEPLVRYNLFWDTDVLYISGDRDTVKVARTVRDTLSLADQGVAVPSFVTNVPDTVAQIGSLYEFDIGLETAKSNYKFTVINSGDIPVGMSESTIETSGILRWTPTAGQIGQHAVRVEIIRQTPPVKVEYLSYIIRVFTASDFPDTTTPADVITVSTTPDTSRAIDSLNTILPVFSKAASAAGNRYGNPLFLNTEINRFELLTQKIRTIIPKGDTVGVLDTLRSVAMDAGNPVVLFNDATLSGGQVRNDMGRFGGPVNNGPPTPGTFTEHAATGLPDSVAIEGQPWTYNPVLSPTANILIVDVIQGPPSMVAPKTGPFGSGKPIPPVWIPALADTGKYLVGVTTFYSGGSARHYFPLRVRGANARPRITTVAPTTAIEDVAFVYAMAGIDDDGNSLSWKIDSGPTGLTVDSLGVVRWTPAQAQVGSASVVVRLTDSGGASNSQTFTLKVSNTNDAPVLAALTDTTVNEDVLFLRALSATDEDPADSTFTFALTSGPIGMVLDDQSRLSWTPPQSAVGSHVVTVRATDAAGGNDSTGFTITVVEVDDPPTISSTPDTAANEDAVYKYAVVATDEEGGTVSYTLTTAPAGMAIDSTGVISWTPALADTGGHTVALRVADPAGQTATQSYQLHVLEVNDPPVIVSRTPVDTLVLIDPGQGVQFDVESTDEEGDLLTLQWHVDGLLRSTGSSFLHVADTTSADTVIARLTDGTSTTSTTWIIDARAIAKASVATDTVDFGNVALDSTVSRVLRVRNPGRTTLTITNLQVGNLAYSASFGSDAIALRDSTTLTLAFAPTARGSRVSSVQFGTNDPDRPTVTIPLSGVGVVPTTAALDVNGAVGDQGVRVGTAPIGDTTFVDLQVSRALQLISYGVELTFDPQVLSFRAFTADAGAVNFFGSGLAPVVTQPSSGTVRVDVAGAAATSGDGTLGRWTFTVASDAEAGASSAIGLSRVELLSSGQTVADVVTASVGVTLEIVNPLRGDGNGDGIIGFDDFFIFADDFGTSNPRSDYNGDGVVDFTDFFLFADFFNAPAARPWPVEFSAAMSGLELVADDRPQDADRLDLALRWQPEE
ncbi:MAG: putative Ig domain-containing protein, partial [bacterium]|nr:putative Ig domain-containing protein [bacterium]